MMSSEDESAGALNLLQDDMVNANGNGANAEQSTPPTESSTVTPDPATNELNKSAESSSTATTIFSTSSETALLVPGKLHSDIVRLKECYVEIIKLIDPYSSTSTSPEENPSIILMLNKDQMMSGITKNKLRVEGLKTNLVNLLDCVRPLCLPRYQYDIHPKRSTVTQNSETEISSLSSRVESLCSQNKTDFEALQTQMESLKTTLSSFEALASNVNLSSQPTPPTEPISTHPDHVLTMDHNIPPVSSYSDNFIPSNECTELFDYLNTLSSYKQERGRSTIKFGEKYAYNGSREDSIVEFPPLVQKVLDNLNQNFVKDDVPLLNSCLVTKYTGPNSFIPEHSDNERAIHSDSSICTLSLGHDTTVRFRDVHTGSVQEQVVKAGSLYEMTRSSQDLFRHSIAKNSALSGTETRFSLTFRSLHWRNNNSTVVIGDSNTGGLNFSKFGRDAPSNHNGTFGNAMPGKRVAAFTVDQLDPFKCTGFNNIVVHCGVNSIRGADVSTEEQVKDIYVDFKTKISDIVTVNKRARLYVSTLLPTKCENINKKVKMFNDLVINDLPRSFKDIRIINHYSRFANVAGLLTPGLSREFNSHGEPDLLHINAAGLRLFSFAVKNALFLRKRSQERGTVEGAGGREQQDGRSYSSVVRNPSRRGGRWRGGANNRHRQS